jgi:hypothetical protein
VSNLSLAGLLVLTLAPLLGQAPPSAPDSSEIRQEHPPDESLATAIRERFARSKISSNNFTVKVVRGTAILRGRTDVIQHKGVATRLARLAGAKSVDNRIEISDRAREKARRQRQRSARRVKVKWRPATRSERH